MNKLKDNELLEKFNDIAGSYKLAHNDYSDYLKRYTDPNSLNDKPHIETLRDLIISQGSNIEVAVKLILSTFSDGPDAAFMNAHGILKPSPDKQKWFDLKDKASWNNVSYIEILAKVLEDEKTEPRFDLTTFFRMRVPRNNLEHKITRSDIINIPRLMNSLREMLIFLDDSLKDELPVFEYSENMFEPGEMKIDFENFTTVLITDPVPDITPDKRKLMADLPWNFVIDLDGYSHNGGLYGSRSYTDDVNDMRALKSPVSNGKTNWYFCGSYQLASFDPRRASPCEISGKYHFIERKSYDSVLDDVIEKIMKAARNFECPVLVIANTNDEKIINRLIAYLNNNLDDACSIFHTGLLNNNVNVPYDFSQMTHSEYTHINAPSCQLFDYLYSIKDQLSGYIKEPVFKEYLIPADNGTVELSTQFRLSLEDRFDILYTSASPVSEDLQKEKRAFYHGGTATWNIIDDVVMLCPQNFEQRLTESVKTSLGLMEDKDKRKLFFVKHIPGCGGTTLVRQIAWKLHTKYPVLYVKKYDQDIKTLIENLYKEVGNHPIVIAADDTLTDLDQLCQLVSGIDRRCCLICSCRVIPNNFEKTGASYHFQSLSDEKVASLRMLYMDECRKDGIAEEDINERDKSFDSKNMSIPFMIGLHYLYDKYDLDSFVSKAFTGAKQTDSAVACLAMCDVGGMKDVPRSVTMNLLGLAPRDDPFKTYPGLRTLICPIKRDNIPYYRFQNILLSRKYLESYQKRYEYDSHGRLYHDLSKMLINVIASNAINENALDLLRAVFVKNKGANSDKLSIIISELDKSRQADILQHLADTFRKQIDDNSSDGLSDDMDDITRKKRQLVSHTYAHLGKLYSDNELTKNDPRIDELFKASIKYMNGNDPDIYHMYAESLFVRLCSDFDADSQYILDPDHLKKRFCLIEEQYDKTAEYGSPVFGMDGKLKLYSKYLKYVYSHENIGEDNFNFNELPTFIRATIEKFMITLERLETEYDLNDATRDITEKHRNSLYSEFLFGNFGKAAEYYHNMMENYEPLSEEWQKAASGFIASKIHACRKQAAPGRNYYRVLKEDSQKELYDLIDKLLFATDIVGESSFRTYSGYSRTSFLFRHWMHLSKILDKAPSNIADRLENGWIYMEDNANLTKKSVQPYYYRAITDIADAMDGKPVSLKDAKEHFSDIRYKDGMSCFIEKESRMKMKRDILVEDRRGMGRLMDISFCKNNEEDILRECIRNKVRPAIVEALFESDEGNGLAKLSISSPNRLSGITVKIKTGRNAGNDLTAHCIKHTIQLILCFSYSEPVALCGKKYVADKTNGEKLDLDEIFRQLPPASAPEDNVIPGTGISVPAAEKPVFNASLTIGQKVLFHPQSIYRYEDHIYINGNADKDKAGFDLAKEFGKLADIEEKKNYYGGLDIIADLIVKKVKEIKCSVAGKNNSGYSLSIDECYQSVDDILNSSKEAPPAAVPAAVEESTSSLPDLKAARITLVVDKSSKKQIEGTFEYQGISYRGKVVQPIIKGKELQNILKRQTVEAVVIGSSEDIYHLKKLL